MSQLRDCLQAMENLLLQMRSLCWEVGEFPARDSHCLPCYKPKSAERGNLNRGPTTYMLAFAQVGNLLWGLAEQEREELSRTCRSSWARKHFSPAQPDMGKGLTEQKSNTEITDVHCNKMEESITTICCITDFSSTWRNKRYWHLFVQHLCHHKGI